MRVRCRNSRCLIHITGASHGGIDRHAAAPPAASLLTLHCSSTDRQAHIEGRFKKYSTTSSVYSKKALSQQSEYIERYLMSMHDFFTLITSKTSVILKVFEESYAFNSNSNQLVRVQNIFLKVVTKIILTTEKLSSM